MVGGKLDPCAGGDRDHRLPARSAAITAVTVAASAAPLMRIRVSAPSSTSISPYVRLAATGGSAAIVTAAKPGAEVGLPHCC